MTELVRRQQLIQRNSLDRRRIVIDMGKFANLMGLICFLGYLYEVLDDRPARGVRFVIIVIRMHRLHVQVVVLWLGLGLRTRHGFSGVHYDIPSAWLGR